MSVGILSMRIRRTPKHNPEGTRSLTYDHGPVEDLIRRRRRLRAHGEYGHALWPRPDELRQTYDWSPSRPFQHL